VSADVFREMVTAHEATITNSARESLLARVGASVSRELIRASEAFFTAIPRTLERLLSCVGA